MKLGARFALTYALVAGVLLGLYAFPFELFGVERDPLEGYLRLFANMAGSLIHLVDSGARVSGTLISGQFPLQIVRNCDAAEINILFASAVVALPGQPSKKLACLVGGLVLLVTTNIARICSLYFVGAHSEAWFKVLHEEVWPLALVAIGTLLFLLSARLLRPEANADASAR